MIDSGPWWPFATWLLLGVPAGIPLLRRGRGDLALAVLPFAGALSIAVPWIYASLSHSEITHWGAMSALASLGLGLAAEVLMRGAPREAPAPRPRRSAARTAAAMAAVGLAAAGLVWAGSSLSRGWPGFEWDGLSIWLVRAKVLAASAAFPFDLFAEGEIARSHWDYPLLLPALLAWFLRLGGLELHQLGLPLGLVAGTVVVATSVGTVRSLPAPLAACIGLAPFVAWGLLPLHFGAYADPLLVMACIAGWSWTSVGAMRRDRAMVVAGGFALAVAAALKHEGGLWLAGNAAGVAALSRLGGANARSALAEALRAAVAALAVAGAWGVACRQMGISNDLLGGARLDLMPGRLGNVALAVLRQLASPQGAVVLIPSLVAMLACAPGDPRERLRRAVGSLLAPTVYCLALVFVYASTPHDLEWHLATSLARVLFVVPAAVFASAACAFGDVRSARR